MCNDKSVKSIEIVCFVHGAYHTRIKAELSIKVSNDTKTRHIGSMYEKYEIPKI